MARAGVPEVQVYPMVSPTRKRFLERKKAKRRQRAEDAYIAAHTFECKNTRRRHGKENQPCGWPVRFSKQGNGAHATCRRCRQMYRCWGGKWFKVEDYEIGVHDLQKAERKAHEGDYGHHPQNAPWETPAHEPEGGYKDVDLLGLHRMSRKITGGPGVIKIGVGMVDRLGKVRHWCRPKKDA